MALKEQVANRILKEIIGPLCKSGDWKILVLDHITTRIVSTCCRMHDVLATGITLVEGLEKAREPLPNMEAIYIITPTESSVKKLVEDLDSSSEPMYQGAHVFFSHACDKKVMNRIAVSKYAKRKIRTLKEADISFLPYESNVFHLDTPDALLEFYTPGSTKDDAFQLIPLQVATLCAFLGLYPDIRYRSANHRTQEIAGSIQAKLDEYKTENKDLGRNQGVSELIILDRGFDVTSPLLHELTYQAMVYDLLPIDNDVFKYQVGTQAGGSHEKEAILDENDEEWMELRHMHIAKVSTLVSKKLQDFLVEKKLKKIDAKASVKEIHRMIQRAPQHQKELDHFSMHVHLAGDCTELYNQDLCAVEQDLAMGTDSNGDPIAEPMQRIMPTLFNRNITANNKLRILTLYISLKGGVDQEDYARLMQHADIPNEDRKAVRNLQHLGARIFNEGGKQKQKELKWKKRTAEYVASRWNPRLKDIAEYAISNGLDDSLYPYLRGRSKKTTPASQPSPSLSGQSSGGGGASSVRWQWTKPSGSVEKPTEAPSAKTGEKTSKFIFFIIGGMSYSEMRAIYEVAKANPSSELIIGSTHLLTPEIFLSQLKQMKAPTGGSL
ncbi:syntaxin-binding protein 1-like isoform X2 [Dysidea avara]|uniref:syntaxin-binding protein 1-like isoform X2 n=1 Tax=Dysidea avara TaxID=196820 RepID=UPI00331865F6